MADKSQEFAFASKVDPPDKPSLKDGSSAAKKKKIFKKKPKKWVGMSSEKNPFPERKHLSPTGI